MSDTRLFRLQRSHVRLCQTVAVVAALLAAISAAAPWMDRTIPIWFGPVAGLFWVALGIPVWRMGWMPDTYAIEISREGIRVPSQQRWAPWSQLAKLVEQSGPSQRVDVLDHSGARFASLPYQLDGFADALQRVAGRVPAPEPARDEFRRARPWLLVMWGVSCALIALGFWWWWSEGDRHGLLLAGLFVAAPMIDHLNEISALSLRSEGVLIRRGPRSRLVPWNDIEGVELALRAAGKGQQALGVFLIRRSGERDQIRPPGTNPFHLERRIAAWLEKTAH